MIVVNINYCNERGCKKKDERKVIKNKIIYTPYADKLFYSQSLVCLCAYYFYYIKLLPPIRGFPAPVLQ